MLVGGSDDLQALEDSGKLDALLKDCLEYVDTSNFPPELRKPKSEEYLKVKYTRYRYYLLTMQI